LSFIGNLCVEADRTSAANGTEAADLTTGTAFSDRH